MKTTNISPNYERASLDESMDNDSLINKARKAKGEFPIVFRGTSEDRLKNDSYSGTYGDTYFGYSANQALSFAQINGKDKAAVVRVDLQELAEIDGITFELRDNDVLVRGKIPKEYMDVFPVS